MDSNRRTFLKKTGIVVGSALITPTIHSFGIINKPILSENIIGHGEFRYKVHKAWGNLDPSTTPVNNCHEMVMDAKGRLIMTTDEPKNNIIIYDKSGKLLNSWTLNFNSAHGLSIFNEGGEDVLFITDPNSGSVVKTTTDGKVLMKLQHPKDVGIYNEKDRFSPTETAIAPNGDIYVADGYGSQYIIQYNAKGEYIRHFGGSGDKDDQFSTAHGVTIDKRDPNNITLMCTSRAHNSFKRFTLDGNYLNTIFLPGAYVCRAVMDDDIMYSGVCWSRLRYLNQTPNSGFITILNKDNKVISNPGGTAPVYENGKLKLMVQESTLFNHCHDVCIDNDKNLYVCQWNAHKTYPIKLERV
ncbi:NHL repeat-containing protein [Snuella sedimenti]|uniref:6-bladed beta-propeller n=1 Tax=Snuella sedimenti TaxID=2798802 RepID=A0A8J7IGD4_9FLAO|nr:6-bladed beta-propeller [Snuella sedimenti]MBJ6366661.1 6-bladed beta-propeller [Snuella sedimenti]